MLELVRIYDNGLGEAGGEINGQDTIRCLFLSGASTAASNYSRPEYACWTSHCPLKRGISESKYMFKYNIATDKFGRNKTVDKFEYDETVEKFQSQGQAIFCVCSGHNSVRDRMCAVSMTPCVTCWQVATLPDCSLPARVGVLMPVAGWSSAVQQTSCIAIVFCVTWKWSFLFLMHCCVTIWVDS